MSLFWGTAFSKSIIAKFFWTRSTAFNGFAEQKERLEQFSDSVACKDSRRSLYWLWNDNYRSLCTEKISGR